MKALQPPKRRVRTFLTTGQVATACQVSIPTVKRWIREGHLAAFQVAGGHFRIDQAELDRFATTHGIPRPGVDRPRVLIVDDETVLVEALTEALHFVEDLEIEVASDGYEGLLKVGTFRPHVLILDVRMPGLDGFQVCRKVKADPATRGVQILAITADLNVRDSILAAGADAFLAKPFDLSALQQEVGRLAARRSTAWAS
jgi:excisionase family DNA binding protein